MPPSFPPRRLSDLSMPKEIPMRISHPAALLALALSIPLFAGCDRNPAPSPSQNTASAAADQTVKPWQTVIDEFIDGYFARYPTDAASRSEEHTSELQSLMRISYAVFC